MTYNWNNMVSITVPTGTNGWLYSGEVIINGVKVRFPVGVPTSVPEPAAVLLKKMIELEQEEDANTAKPQNHYVGDVTIPAGKTLTIEKGANFVDNSSPSEVVILPETVTTVVEEMDGQAPITTPLSATPTEGATAKVTYNGTEYPCTVANASEEGIDAFVMGNFAAIGMPFDGSNPDAPFVVALIPAGDSGGYGMVVPLDGATSITLSIVQVDAASGGGAVETMRVNITTTDGVYKADKPFATVLEAVLANKPVEFRLNPGDIFEHCLHLSGMQRQTAGGDVVAINLHKITGGVVVQYMFTYDEQILVGAD